MSAREAVDAALDRLHDLDDPAVVISHVPPATLRAWAADVDVAPSAEVPLRGTTFTLKDNIDLVGMRTTAGCPSFGAVAERSATVVERLMRAGALPVAKVNMDQFATGLVGTRSPYGTPRNPFDAELVPGGSSSGSAVSVVHGLATFSLGTDTAGSGRVPAAMCGLVGWKPTPGWISTAGVVPAVRSIDCVSVFAADVGTAWRVVATAGGHDPLDPFSRVEPPTSRAVARTVGLVSADLLSELGVAPHVLDGYAQACAAVAASGRSLVEIDLEPFLEAGHMLYGGPWVAERFAAVGHVLDDDVAGIDPHVLGIIRRAQQWTAVEAHQARYRLAELRSRVDELFSGVDALLTPTIAREVTLAEVEAEPIEANRRLGTFTTFTNLLDLCALALPTPFRASPDLPPVSVSLQAPAWADEMLLGLASAIVAPDVMARAGAVAHVDTSAGLRPPRGWITLAVAGAHLRGQPLEHQLIDRGAVWMCTTSTSSDHRLYALSGTTPPKPGLVRVAAGEGAPIEVDVWALSPAAFGDFVASVPPPLCIGTVELADGSTTSGFLCEPRALDGATDITRLGGWRAHVRAAAVGP